MPESTHSEGKSCSDIGRMLVLSDPSVGELFGNKDGKGGKAAAGSPLGGRGLHSSASQLNVRTFATRRSC